MAMTGPIPAGTYRLRHKLPAFYPDRRKRYDWRSREVPAGTLMVVEDFGPEGTTVMRVFPSGEYSSYWVGLRELPDGALEQVEETPRMWLRRCHPGMSVAAGILDQLVAQGLLSMDQVRDACDAVFAEAEDDRVSAAAEQAPTLQDDDR